MNHVDGAEPAARRPPQAATAEQPRLRLLGDLGSWALGEPMSAGSGQILAQVSLEYLDELLVTLDRDGLRALIAVLRNARHTSDERGRPCLELPEYSGEWLRRHVGLSKTAAYRAAAALRDAGLVQTASMPGVRGSAGKQRAVVSHLVGLPGGLEPGATTRRGRRRGALSQVPGERQSVDPSTLSQNTGKGQASAQVTTVSQDPGNGSSTGVVVKSGVELLSSLSMTPPVPAAPEVQMVSATARSWRELRERLAALSAEDPDLLPSAVRPLISARASEAARLSHTLKLPGSGTHADRVTRWLCSILTAEVTVEDRPGLAGGVLADLHRAGVAQKRDLAKTDIGDLMTRVVVASTVGLDSHVEKWKGWLYDGLGKPAAQWGETSCLTELRDILDADHHLVRAAPRPMRPAEAERCPAPANPDVPTPPPPDRVAPSTPASDLPTVWKMTTAPAFVALDESTRAAILAAAGARSEASVSVETNPHTRFQRALLDELVARDLWGPSA